MWRVYSVIYLLSQMKLCQLTTTEPPKPSNMTAPPTTTWQTTDTTWQSTDPSTLPTRLPQLLRLGNQTVDINKSFKVPQIEDTSATTHTPNTTHSTAGVVNITSTVAPKRVTQEVNSSFSKPNLVGSASKTWQGTKHEHEGRYGPQFEDGQGAENITVVVQAGDTVLFDCKVSLLRDKTVSWLKRQPGETPRLLTVGGQTYTGDTRFTVQFRYPGNWRLQITGANTSDEGLYECQLSTHPPRVISVNLQVRTMSVAIVDDSGEPLREQYYEAGSTLSLRCRVRGGGSGASGAVWWLHGTRELHRDASRGGVAVRSVGLRNGNGVNSTLRVNRLAPQDAGNYTCAVPNAAQYAYTVLVHVLNESLAELQQGSSHGGPRPYLVLMAAVMVIVMALAQDEPS